ncbi:hypothetical protein GCM10022225_73420 [Plantactinospora mayteni]|uniref:Transcriptional regulator LacI/GalR-like sensor domain-containing protein n=1 Tax=Plantactinospora mayteni TaxID=566021 RepID=A0ABQ4F1P6_9ACTN|nr:hypothetical protein Pma05_73690 [Plantactinospora mayteni]
MASDVQAVGVISAAASLGLRIPDDLAVVSIDGTRAAAFANPGLTTVSQPVARMAACAVQHVTSRQREVIHRTYTGRLVRRRSCGCATSVTEQPET